MFRYEEIFNSLCIRINNGEFNGRLFPTENKLASEYGVSRITVRAALDMLEKEGKIERKAGKGTYLSEQNITPKKKKLIGVLLCKIDAAFGLDALVGIEKQAEAEGYSVILKLSYDRQDNEEKMLNELVETGVDGIIYQSCHGDYTKAAMNLAGSDFPLVAIDRNPEKIPISSVFTDNYGASYELTDYLYSLGHRNIALVTIPTSFASSIEKRSDGFKRCCFDHGLPMTDENFVTDIVSPITQNEKDRQKDKAKVKAYVLKHPEITAFVATERRAALIVQEILDELKLNCPENYSLVCFDSEPVYGKNVMVTHIKQNQDEMGKKAVKLLIDRINNGGAQTQHIYVRGYLCSGGTTARPKR